MFDTSAAIWAGLGHTEQAAILLGTAEKQRGLAGIPRPKPNQHHLDRFIEPARRSVPEQVWIGALTRGALLTIEEGCLPGNLAHIHVLTRLTPRTTAATSR